MALSRIKTWSSGEVLTASELNAEFNNILNNAVSLISPLTAALDLNGFELILDADADTSITADTDDQIDFKINGTDELSLTATKADNLDDIAALSHTSGATIVSDGTNWEAAPYTPNDNFIINGSCAVWQRGTTFDSTTTPANSDDTYAAADRFYLLTDGNDIFDVTRQQDSTTREYEIRLDVETANKKGGIAQIIEAENCSAILANGKASISFQAKRTGTTLTTIRAGLIAWSGTANSVTSDVISAWGSAGTNPTLIANATFENTPADLTVTTSYQTFTIENITVDTASTGNLILIIWQDLTTTTAGDFLHIRRIKVNPGVAATPFYHPTYSAELAQCEQYLRAFDAPDNHERIGNGFGGSTTIAYITLPLRQRMRADPSLTATAGDWQLTDENTSVDMTDITIGTVTQDAVLLTCTVAAGLTQFRPYNLKADGSAARTLFLSAEL